MGRILSSRRDKHHHSRYPSAHHHTADTSPYSKLGPFIRTVGSYIDTISKPTLRYNLGNLSRKRPSLPHRIPSSLFHSQAGQPYCHIDCGAFQHGFRGGPCPGFYFSPSLPPLPQP